MECVNVVKKPSGKLLKVEAVVENGVFKQVEFTGDFFAHPEERLEELESALRGIAPGDVENVVQRFVGRLVFVGISFNDVIEAIKGLKCVENPARP